LPQHKSAKKRVKTARKAALRNRRSLSMARNVVKEFRESKEKSPEKMKLVAKTLDKIASKNVIHKNKASRLKSRLAKSAAKKTAK
jgi:small subunit ribosomal protein S20